ncbi:hypothetical protein BC834DRAFT_1038352 [Gloeopeniophorella convolvens]|nr:hypothetical protein BC834DRAFT_1038352 [Gloeopeniophorella convolvens]
MAAASPTTHPTEPLDSPFDPYASELLRPFIPPGETEMSSPSGIDSSGDDGQDGAVTLAAIPTVDPQRHQRLSLRLVAPAILVVVITAGIASALLAWLIIHSTQPSLKRVWQDKAFLLDEGTKIEGGQKAARLMGLTISSAASTLVGISSPILIGLYAFRTAQAWLKASRGGQPVHDAHLPTPLQYGLLLELLTGGGLTTLFSTFCYFFMRQKASASRILKQAFVVVVTIYILTHAISGVDLWLHTVTTTVVISTSIPSTTSRLFSVVQNTCPPYGPGPLNEICLMEAGGWKGDPRPGMLVASNTSTSLQAITLADHADMAVLVVPGIPIDLEFRSTSFGARTSCELVTPLCQIPDSGNASCPGFPPSKFPVVTAALNSTASVSSGESKAFLLSSNFPPPADCFPGNPACTQMSPDQISDNWLALSPDPDMVNLYTLWLQLVWASDGDVPFASPNNTDIVRIFSNMATMLANCSLSFYNVTLDYSNGTYALADEELSNTGLSDGLAAPTRLGHFLSHLIANVEGLAFTSTAPDEVAAFLMQDVSRLALASAAGITSLRENTLSLSTVTTASLGRYPFWPVIVLLALLYAHTALALLIFLTTLLFSQADRIRVPPYGDSATTKKTKFRTASMLELAHLRLTSPAAVVAALFQPVGLSRPARANLAARTNALDIFDEKRGADRLRMGVDDDDAEDGMVFGIWQDNVAKEVPDA